jgi:hypothetical protein
MHEDVLKIHGKHLAPSGNTTNENAAKIIYQNQYSARTKK